MFLSKVLHKPNWVGVIMITLLFGAGFIYAFAFDGFNIEKVTGSEVEVWLASTGDSGSGGDDTPDDGSDPPDDGGDPPQEDCDCGNKHCHVTEENDDGTSTTKKGCKAKKADGSNPCNDQTRKYPCPADADCRGKGGGAHACTDQGCPKMPKPNGQPGKIDVCKKSPKKSCRGKC